MEKPSRNEWFRKKSGYFHGLETFIFDWSTTWSSPLWVPEQRAAAEHCRASVENAMLSGAPAHREVCWTSRYKSMEFRTFGCIWMHLGVSSSSWGTPQHSWFIVEHPNLKFGSLGVHLFSETTPFGGFLATMSKPSQPMEKKFFLQEHIYPYG